MPEVGGSKGQEAAGRIRVDLLVATCNGASYLEAQLDSLLAQELEHCRILISDDGSTDATPAIIADYASRWPGRIVLVPGPRPGGSAVLNFANLMHASLRDGVAKWMAFCDQDDVWLAHKMRRLGAAMQELEARVGAHRPCLVHCDLQVVDARLQPLHPSFVRHQRTLPSACGDRALLSLNTVTGCATLVNRALVQAALPLPDSVIMHDWWCALLSIAGARAFVDEPLVLYRQHGRNQLGAKGRDLRSRWQRLRHDPAGLVRRVRGLGRSSLEQALAFQTRLRELGWDECLAAEYIAWRRGPRWRRLVDYRRYFCGPELDRLSRALLW